MITIISGFIFAYLLGSIPTAVIIGKTFFNVDVRDHGSGNAGATNTFRILGFKAGISVFLIDGVKGFVATYLAVVFNLNDLIHLPLIFIQFLLTIMVVTGHIFPIFAGFKGGKGVATMLGSVLGILPLGALLSFGVFLAVFILSRFVSLGSIIAGISFPFWVYFALGKHDTWTLGFSIFFALILLFMHRKNIQRLIHGKENKISFSKR
ncbi:MAG TPA: glycerol-3-phosphate 1-O-acyltransferase PlsY [Bacteroidales bacterium]|nr:glycerol-3-phosphate 1-O-acyltransferase PlsY [Bacteroidales bacterium]